MKFMKLGSKPDIFQTSDNVTAVVSDLVSDISIEVDGHKFLLHKFPLLSKSECLNKIMKGEKGINKDEVVLPDFPGSVESFEMCAKFCYGITFTLNAYNVAAVRCGAEYLEMSEAIEKGNLIFKLEVFLNSSILRGWKDCIICLQNSKTLVPWAEDLKLLSRCVDSISFKTAVDASKVDWSFTYTRPLPSSLPQSSDIKPGSPPWNGSHSRRHHPVPKDWWAEDICDLDVDLYWRVMVSIKAKGAPPDQVGEALRLYALRWLPGVSKEQTTHDSARMLNGALAGDFVETSTKHRALLESLVSLLPPEKGSCSCSFLLKLLKSATILNASQASKMELAHRIGLQLEEASVHDLMIPSLSYANDSLYDVDLVQLILEHYLMQETSPPTSPVRSRRVPFEHRRTRSAEQLDVVDSRRSTAATHGSKLRVAKLIDGYLAEIARDPNLPLVKFVQIAESIPDFARPIHDGLYRAIDMYLKEHPGISKSDRKRISRLMDCKKLSMEACVHACQNDRLPLRVVVQVLFFEQVRTAMSGGLVDLPQNVRALLPHSQEIAFTEANGSMSPGRTVDENWETVHEDFKVLKGDLAAMKIRLAEAEKERGNLQTQQQPVKNLKSKSGFPLFRPKKLLNRLFPGLLGDYSKRPVIGSLPGKRTNPYSIP